MAKKSRLRERMAEDLRLAGLAETTQDRYLRAVANFACWHGRTPAVLGREDVRAWLLYLTEEKNLRPSSMAVYFAAIKFLYEVTLLQPEKVEGFRISRSKPAPRQIPTEDEVRRILEVTHDIFYRTLFLTAYQTGMRRNEIIHLCTEDIDARANLIRVRQGKGGKERVTLLGPVLLETLRSYWRTLRPPGPWVFPGRVGLGFRDVPISPGRVSRHFAESVLATGIQRGLSFHGLRHAFATRLLASGVDVRVIQVLMGHEQISTTAIYTHVTPEIVREILGPLDMAGSSR